VDPLPSRRRPSFWLTASLALAALACARTDGLGSSTTTAAGGLHTLSSGGEERQYLVHLPPNPGRDPLPLILNFHGFSSNAAEQQALSGMSTLADEAGFIVVYPQALGDPPTWRIGPGENVEKDAAFVEDMVDRLESDFSIDSARIYATGISNGGGMVHRLGCDQADRFAAIAPVSGAYLLSEVCQPSRPLPVLAFHGTRDRIVPYDGAGKVLPPIPAWAARWAERNGCTGAAASFYEQGVVSGEIWTGCDEGATVILYTIDGGGHIWPGSGLLPGVELPSDDIDASRTIWEFFQKHPHP